MLGLGMCSDPPWPHGTLRVVMGDLRCEGPIQGLVHRYSGESQESQPKLGTLGSLPEVHPGPCTVLGHSRCSTQVRAKCNLSVTSSHPSLINPSTRLEIRWLKSAWVVRAGRGRYASTFQVPEAVRLAVLSLAQVPLSALTTLERTSKMV